MGLASGIVGLPNVGKSTLFNALTETAAADVANYPFCTIEPNTGRVAVPDPRLAAIAGLAGSGRIIPTFLEFVDIAGLVRGASRGEGLGNQFLANIRETDAIVHVLRCFDGGGVVHVDGSMDPLRDADTVETELMLADLESLERRSEAIGRRIRGGDREGESLYAVVNRLCEVLAEGRPARSVTDWNERDTALVRSLALLSAKPVLYVCNVAESDAAAGNAASDSVMAMAREARAGCVVISAAIEAEIARLSDAEERAVFLEELGLEEPGLARLVREGYRLLDLITFFTTGLKETRAWTLRRGETALRAGGTIHSDFERGFIRAETVSTGDFLELGGEQQSRDAGRMRAEGAGYQVQDGDILRFRFNV